MNFNQSFPEMDSLNKGITFKAPSTNNDNGHFDVWCNG